MRGVLVEPVTIIRRQDQQHRRKRTRRKDVLTSLVMGSHVRGLECWHALIRTERLPFEVNCVLHVDSHPDMMLPKGDFTAIEQDPRSMYECLESSQGGIAEWLLPAFFLGHCTRLIWLRASWCDQLRDGESVFHIGIHVEDKSLRVTSTEPYFNDEPNTYAPLSELERPVQVTLLVVSLDDSQACDKIKNFLNGANGQPKWLLDICLDYFAVSNPFLDHATQIFGQENAEKLRAAYTTVRWRMKYENERCRVGGARSQVEVEEKQRFEDLIKVLFNFSVEFSEDDMSRKLNELYDDPSQVQNLLDISRMVRSKCDQGLLIAIELMDSPGLPHHPIPDEVQQARFAHLLTDVLKTIPPSACIIAKSDEDEYTPNNICNNLESWTAELMTTAWSHCKHVETISVEVYEDELHT